MRVNLVANSQAFDVNDLVTVDFQDQRVLTTKQLADVYETTPLAITQNFNNHRSHFVEGKHYYFLKGADLRDFKNYIDNIYVVDRRAPQLYLWTERGANRHCKILDTDKAWEQFDNLEDTYFHVKQMKSQYMIPKTFAEALRLAADIQEENERLKQQERELLPKASGYDLIVDSEGTQSMNTFAKSMNWGRTRLYAYLRDFGIFIQGAAVPYQSYINRGYFIVKQTSKCGRTFPVTFITPKGMNFIVKKVDEWGIMDDLLSARPK